MFLMRTSREAEPWMRESAVTVHGQSAGPTRLIGHLMPFEQLGDLPQIETSRYVQQMLNGASEA